MPHAVIETDLDLARWAESFGGIQRREGRDVLRTDQVYVATDGQAVLIDALVVEAGRKLPFYVRVSRHDRGTLTVRVDPMTHPDRSDGVRELVGQVVLDLLESGPAGRVLRTNLVLPSVEPESESQSR